MASPDPHPRCGDYYGTHGGYWQARCNCPAPTPAEDVFGVPYPTTEAQLQHLLAFGCFTPAPESLWHAPLATTPTTSITLPTYATTVV